VETIKRILRADRREICYIRYTLESYDGMAVVSTVDPCKALVEIRIAPGCEDMVVELLKDLAEKEGVKIVDDFATE
jgi:hypothetical protein